MAVGTSDLARGGAPGTALTDTASAYTWRELDELLNRAINGLLALDFPVGQRIAVYAQNASETVLGHIAGTLAGRSTVPISFHLTPSEVDYILQDSEAGVLLVGPETAEQGTEAARRAGCGTVLGWRCEGVADVQDWHEWLRSASPEEPPRDLVPQPHLHYTSGTTGRPKGTETPPAMFPGGGGVAEYVERLRAGSRAVPGSTALVVSPLYHTGPLSSIRSLLAGVGLVVLPRFDAERTLEAIEQFEVSTTMMVPTHFQRLLALPEDVRRKYDVSSISMIAHTGAACPVEVKRAMIDWFGPVLFEAYGATEAGTTNAITSREWLEHPGSVGRCLPPFEAVVVDDGGNELGPNEVGNLYFRDGSGRGIVYHNDPEKTASVHLEPGVFTLGEIGYVDDDGYVYITDRQSDMVVSGGVNIYPAEAEQLLLEHPAVADVVCIGVPHEDLGEQLKALVVPADPDAPPTEDDLVAWCRERIAHFKVPKSIDIVDSVPRNSMGKVNKRALRRPYWPSDRTIG